MLDWSDVGNNNEEPRMFQVGDSVRLRKLDNREAMVFSVANKGKHLIVTYGHVTRGVRTSDVEPSKSSAIDDCKT
jgi:hypothetical protein